MLASVELVSAFAYDRIDTAHSGTDGSFGHDVDRADLTYMIDVGTAAKLTAPAVFTNGNHTHDVAVLLSEQVHGAQSNGIIELHFLSGDGEIFAQLLVDTSFHGVHRILARSAGPLEVETQTVRRIFGTALGGLRTKLLTQRLVHHVGSGVRAGDGATAIKIDVGVDLGTDNQCAFGQTALVHDEILDRLLYIVDLEHSAIVRKNLTLIGELTTGLRVERGAVENDFDIGRTGDCGNGALAFLHDAQHLGSRGHVGVTEEVDGLNQRLLEIVVDGKIHVVALLKSIGTCAALLLGHKLTELGLIDLDTLICGHFKGDLDWEAIGVVQLERIFAGNGVGSGFLGLCHSEIKDFGTGFQRAAERIFLAVSRLGHIMESVIEFRIARLHSRLGSRQQGRHDRTGHTEFTHGLDSTTQQSTQHIATTVVGWAHTVRHDHQGGAHMVGHDAEAHVHGFVITIHTARQLLGCFDDRENLVGLINVLLALHQIGKAFQTSAGVDILVLKFAHDVQVGLGLDIIDLVVFEHEIPNFNVAVLVGDRTAFHTVFRSTVHVDFGARAAGARTTGRPEVVFHAHDLDMFGVNTLVLPHRAGFLIIGEGGHPQFLRIETVAALVLRGGQQLIRIVDGFFLEVITEGEIAQHLEESTVTGGFADLVDIQSTHALLIGCHAALRRSLLAHEVRNERDHACDGEQGGRVRRDQRCRRHDKMAVLFEIIKIALRDFRSAHLRLSSFFAGKPNAFQRIRDCCLNLCHAEESADFARIFGVKFSFAGSAGFVELIEQAFKGTYGHVILVWSKQELPGRVRSVGLDVCLRLGHGHSTDAHTDGDPEETLEHHSPLLLAALLTFFLFMKDCAVVFRAYAAEATLMTGLPRNDPYRSVSAPTLLAVVEAAAEILLTSSNDLLTCWTVITLSSSAGIA